MSSLISTAYNDIKIFHWLFDDEWNSIFFFFLYKLVIYNMKHGFCAIDQGKK